MHAPIFEDRFEYDKRGELVLITNARGRGYDENGKLKLQCEFDCLKTFENGTQLCRNLYINNFYGGYYVEFPDEYYPSVKHNWKLARRGYEHYGKCNSLCNVPSFGFTDSDAEIIYKKYPNFKYVIQKWNGWHTKRDIMYTLQVWKEHPEVELPLSLGYEKVIYSQQFYKMKKEQLKKLYKFMVANKGKDYGITDLRFIMKHSEEELLAYKETKRIIGKNISVTFSNWIRQQLDKGYSRYRIGMDYEDYIRKCRAIGKNTKDEYWAYPNDFVRRYKEVKEQWQNLEDLKEMERQKEKIGNYLANIGSLADLKYRAGRYDLFVPTTTQEWVTQASKLNQCICRYNYMDKCNDNYILVFIYKDGEPCATCEITDLKAKKIGQFYGNEENRANCYPDETTKKVMYSWLDNLQVA